MDAVQQITICVALPLLLLFAITPRKEKGMIGLLLSGMAMWILCYRLSVPITRWLSVSPDDYTRFVAPVVEEIAKATPIIGIGLVVHYRWHRVMGANQWGHVGAAVGFGFAVFENVYYLVATDVGLSPVWVLARGLSTGLLHGVCGYAIALAMLRAHRSAIATVATAIGIVGITATFHSCFNIMMLSPYYSAMLGVPLVAYLALWWASLWVGGTSDTKPMAAPPKERQESLPGSLVSELEERST
jgi:RsiW-degrading membrane proteinase PrsW (M82 family)